MEDKTDDKNFAQYVTALSQMAIRLHAIEKILLEKNIVQEKDLAEALISVMGRFEASLKQNELQNK